MQNLDNAAICNAKLKLQKHLDVLNQRRSEESVVYTNYLEQQHNDYNEFVHILKEVFTPNAIKDRGNKILLTLPTQNARVPKLEMEIFNNLPNVDSGESGREAYAFVANTIITSEAKTWQRSNAISYVVRNLLDILDYYYITSEETNLKA